MTSFGWLGRLVLLSSVSSVGATAMRLRSARPRSSGLVRPESAGSVRNGVNSRVSPISVPPWVVGTIRRWLHICSPAANLAKVTAGMEGAELSVILLISSVN